MDLRTPDHAPAAAGSALAQLRRRHRQQPVPRGPILASASSRSRTPAADPRTSSRARKCSIRRRARCGGRRRSAASAATKSATTKPAPQGQLLPVDAARIAQRRVRVRHVQRSTARRQPPDRRPTTGSTRRHVGDSGRHGRAGPPAGLRHLDRLVPDQRGEPGHELPHALAVRERHVAAERPADVQPRPALRQEPR